MHQIEYPLKNLMSLQLFTSVLITSRTFYNYNCLWESEGQDQTTLSAGVRYAS